MTLTGARHVVIEPAPAAAEAGDAERAATAALTDAGIASPDSTAERHLLEAIIERSEAAPSRQERLTRLLSLKLDSRKSIAEGLLTWFGANELRQMKFSAEAILLRLASDLATIDELLAATVNQVLHHPEFQRLEASWRGLEVLVNQAAALNEETKSSDFRETEPPDLKIKVFNISKRELKRDLDDALEFDQSQFFKKVYEDEYGTPGGEPYGLLVGDFDFSKHPDDVSMLRKVAEVSAAAHCPFISAAAPNLLGLDDYAELQRHPNLAKLAKSAESPQWRSFRECEESRYVGLLVPRVLMRHPYELDGSRDDGFRFEEDLGPGSYLWGRAVYAFAGVVGRAFARSGWLADIRGVRQDDVSGGLVDNLPVHHFSTDRDAFKFSTNVAITDAQEREIADLGMMSLCPCHGTDLAAFYSVPSVQKSKVYESQAATTNARMSSMLHYILCASRFAHYLKVIVRDKIGRFTSAGEIESWLRDWLVEYVTEDDNADARTKARRPLRAAGVKIRPKPAEPGVYDCEIHLQPHHQLDDLTGSIRLISTMEQTSERR